MGQNSLKSWLHYPLFVCSFKIGESSVLNILHESSKTSRQKSMDKSAFQSLEMFRADKACSPSHVQHFQWFRGLPTFPDLNDGSQGFNKGADTCRHMSFCSQNLKVLLGRIILVERSEGFCYGTFAGRWRSCNQPQEQYIFSDCRHLEVMELSH